VFILLYCAHSERLVVVDDATQKGVKRDRKRMADIAWLLADRKKNTKQRVENRGSAGTMCVGVAGRMVGMAVWNAMHESQSRRIAFRIASRWASRGMLCGGEKAKIRDRFGEALCKKSAKRAGWCTLGASGIRNREEIAWQTICPAFSRWIWWLERGTGDFLDARGRPWWLSLTTTRFVRWHRLVWVARYRSFQHGWINLGGSRCLRLPQVSLLGSGENAPPWHKRLSQSQRGDADACRGSGILHNALTRLTTTALLRYSTIPATISIV